MDVGGRGGLHVWAALRPYSSVYGERFGQHGRSVVDGRLADAALEDWQVGGETGYCDAIRYSSEVNGLLGPR